MDPLLILFIHLGLGGVQRKIVDIVNYLRDCRPNQPITILLRNKEDFDLSREIKNPQVKIIVYSDWVKIKIPFFFPLFVVYKIWQIRPKAILAFLDFVSLPCIWARILLFWRRFRLILSEDHYASKVISGFKLGKLRNFLVKMFYPFADVIFTCSQATKEDLIRSYGLPRKKIKIIRNWTTFTTRKVKRKEIYDLIYIGRMYKTKNLDFLIRALKKIKKLRKTIKLCLMGDGQEKNKLKALVRKLKLQKNITFFKPRLDVENLLAKAKIFVLVSQRTVEGFPIIILEAMATKTPVLTTDFAGAREFLKDSENCYLFKNEGEFIKKAILLLNNHQARDKISEKAYNYVKRYHSSQNILDYLKELNL